MYTCAICGGTKSLFTIEIPLEDGEGTFDKFVCGSCWEVIAEIANRRVNDRITQLEAQVAALLDAVPSAKVGT